ncbi:MAG: extracellular solute-binding protein [Treponema sp.]|nr:extracellular solute-binding protein [Treponema sp.]
MGITQKTHSMCLAALVLALSFTGCKKNEPSKADFVPRYGKDKQGSIYIAGHYTNFEALEAEFDLFKNYYPAVDIHYDPLDNYNRTILPAVMGDEPPDIYFTFTWMLDKDGYRPLFDEAENLAIPDLGLDLDFIQKGSVIKGKESGRVLMIPIIASSYGMLVNENLFKKHGMDIPTDYRSLKDSVAKFKELGYSSPVLGFSDASWGGLFSTMAMPYFCSCISGNDEAIAKLNSLEPEAGVYLKDLLAFIQDFMDTGAVDLEEYSSLKKGNDLIFRFFEGDIPLVFCPADVVSSTKKRERISEPFMANPFKYAFYLIPTDRGRIFLKMTSIDVSVNKNSMNLDMANEFIRFLITPTELNRLAMNKRMLTATEEYSFDDIYKAFDSVDEYINYDDLGLLDNAIVQVKKAVNAVVTGSMSCDEAAGAFGSL